MNEYKNQESSMYNFRIWLKGDASVHHGSYVAWCIKEGWHIRVPHAERDGSVAISGASHWAPAARGAAPPT